MNKLMIKNTLLLYAMNIAKMLFPLITLPYLTRVLSVECYGTVAYVKSIIQYVQLIVDFGFMLSGTKDIVNSIESKEKMETEIGNILLARIFLGCTAGFGLLILSRLIPILRNNSWYAMLSFTVVFLSCFLFDYLFRGLEQMHVITIRFVLMKSIATLLTFVFVRRDSDIFWIPVLDILGTSIAIVLVIYEIRKRNIKIKFTCLKDILTKIRTSAIYFASDMATTAFGALNTFLIGIYISSKEVAYWSVCMQLITAIQSLYTPITNGIYPYMVKYKNFNMIKKIIIISMPLILVGCGFTFWSGKYALLLIGGRQYADADQILKAMIPILLFSFPSMLFGWPTLGSINKARETTITTVITAIVQILGLVVLIATGYFTILNIALLRGITEFILMFLRILYCYKFRAEFNIL